MILANDESTMFQQSQKNHPGLDQKKNPNENHSKQRYLKPFSSNGDRFQFVHRQKNESYLTPFGSHMRRVSEWVFGVWRPYGASYNFVGTLLVQNG